MLTLILVLCFHYTEQLFHVKFTHIITFLIHTCILVEFYCGYFINDDLSIMITATCICYSMWYLKKKLSQKGLIV